MLLEEYAKDAHLYVTLALLRLVTAHPATRIRVILIFLTLTAFLPAPVDITLIILCTNARNVHRLANCAPRLVCLLAFHVYLATIYSEARACPHVLPTITILQPHVCPVYGLASLARLNYHV